MLLPLDTSLRLGLNVWVSSIVSKQPQAAAAKASRAVLHDVPLQPDVQSHTPGAEQLPLTHPAGHTAHKKGWVRHEQ
jgi:hypothetical protein